jgi:DNA helicase-2/ATP-dependent DNA helicase PcrA
MAEEESEAEGSVPQEEEEPEHLVRLNPEQRRAVTTIEGPLLILAGAGSGKTRVLTRRIAHLLHCGVDPKSILAVTFTNKAAAEMKERVAELIGDAAANLWVSTFHSTCCRILRQEIEIMGWTKRFAIYDDDDQLRMIKGILDQLGLDTSEARDVLGKIDFYKNRMVSVDAVVEERRGRVGDTFVTVWREYDEALRAADAVDFNDLIGRAVQLFTEHPAVLSKWRERFHYVMVDEYQDTNKGQYELLRLLAVEHRNLAVVGDDDQSIYGFRGADVSNILNFEKDYPEATVVRLEQNYRSSGHILTLANAVVEKNEGRLDKRLWTQADNGPRVQLKVAADVESEATWVATAAHTLRRRGHDYGEIAIIYRTNAIARPFEAALRRLRIPYKLVGGKKFYERREIRDVLAYLRLVVNPNDDAALLRVINVPTRGIGAKTQQKLREDAAGRGMPLLRTARLKGGAKTKAERGLKAFTDLIDELGELARELPPGELVQEAIERSGYRAMLEADTNDKEELTPDAKSRLENLAELVRDASSFRMPPDAFTTMDHLTAWMDRTALTGTDEEIPDGGQVTLMTVHSSKGLEYPVVFVVQMNEGVFPHARSAENGVDEERRLAYVAFTRAMKRLVVTRSATEGRPGKRASGKSAAPSRFLYGVPAEVVDGDLPGGDPLTSAQERRADTSERRSKRAAFFEARRQRAVQPSGEHTLREIESLDDLQIGISLHHPRLGVATLRAIQGTKVQLDFGGAGRRWLQLGSVPLRIVLD